MPALVAFSKAALDGGIEHDAVQALYQVTLLPCASWILFTLESHAPVLSLLVQFFSLFRHLLVGNSHVCTSAFIQSQGPS